MSATTVFLIIIGICLIVGSFIFLDKDGNQSRKQVVMLNDYELDEQELAKLQDSIRTVIKEYSDHLVEDTNKQLGTVANEKILEISELAEQVLDDIKKAHQECVFLYDMLEDKSEQLKEYVSNSAEKLFAMQQDVMRVVPEEKRQAVEDIFQEATSESQVKEHLLEQVKQNEEVPIPEENLEEIQDIQKRNQQILAMFDAGKEPLAIAKELDLGVGEVQLVVDLFQGDK